MFNRSKSHERLLSAGALLSNILVARSTQTWRSDDERATYRAVIRLLDRALAMDTSGLQAIYLYDLKHTYAPPQGSPDRRNPMPPQGSPRRRNPMLPK